MRTIAVVGALVGTLCCSGETVVYDAETKPAETEVREGAWCVKADCDLSACGEVTLEFAKPVRQGERFQVQFLNDGARESLTRGNGGANILQFMIWKFPPEGTNRVTLLLPPDVPAFRACASRVKETRLWGLWARLWKNRYVKERTGTDGGHLLCCTLDPAKVKEIRVVRMGRTVAEMQYPGAAPAVRVTRIVAGGEPMRIDGKDLPKWAKMSPEEFFPFMDRYGQFRWAEWPGKVHDDTDFAKALEAEDADLAAHPAPADRDKWGGWTKGPNYGDKGGWRTVKRNGKWWIVDPDGNLWWSHGPVRVSHSCGMTPYKGREDHFVELPDESSPFGAFYHTRDELLWPYYVKFGCTNTYDFSAANLYRKYGDDWEDVWGRRVHRRLRSWGANTIANSSDKKVMKIGGTPYCDRFELKSRPIAETEKLLAWWPFRDPFDPSFRTEVYRQFALHEDEMKDPWCFGFFVDNELQWGHEGDLAKWTWKSPEDQPARVEFVRRLQAKYGAVPAEPSEADCREFSLAIVNAYFSTIRDAFRKAAPGKLYLGCRFSGSDAFVIREAAKYCDVMSFNCYRRDLLAFDNVLPPEIDKPAMIGEFHFGALDRGPFTTGIIQLESQADRAATYRRYLTSALRDPRLVGVHWHQYSDDVATGRFDGENMQIGWTDVCDNPYPETIAAIREVADRLYPLRDGSETMSLDRLTVKNELVLQAQPAKGHLQDVWYDGHGALYWAHTKELYKTDVDGKVLAKADVEGHHAGLATKDGRLYVAVCPMQGTTGGKTTPECRVTIGEYDAETLAPLALHRTDIHDRSGSLAILDDGTFLVGCLRPQDIALTQVRFHHLDRDFKLIRSYVLDDVPVKLGIEVIKRKGDEFYLCMYGTDKDKKPLGFDTIVLGPDFRERRRLKLGGGTGLVFGGESAWTGWTRADKETKVFTSKIHRKK